MIYFYVLKYNPNFKSLIAAVAEENLPSSHICDICVQINVGIKMIHKLGYIYNSINMKNIMMYYSEKQNKYFIQLFDFGDSTPYITTDGIHIK